MVKSVELVDLMNIVNLGYWVIGLLGIGLRGVALG